MNISGGHNKQIYIFVVERILKSNLDQTLTITDSRGIFYSLGNNLNFLFTFFLCVCGVAMAPMHGSEDNWAGVSSPFSTLSIDPRDQTQAVGLVASTFTS